MIETTRNSKHTLSVKYQSIFTVLSLALAVILPQLFHTLGAAVGVENALGELLLPMHLPIMLAGAVAGPYVGLISGALSPVISMLVSNMPSPAVLPFMMIEISVYGVSAGVLKNVKIPVFFKVLFSQVAGRVARWLASIVAVYLIGIENIGVFSVFDAAFKGLIGIMLQWVIVCLFVFYMDNRQRLK